MNERDIIRTVRIEHQVTGVQQAVAGNKAVEASNRDLGASATDVANKTEVSAKRMASVTTQFEKLSKAVDPANRALFEFNKAQRIVRDAVDQNGNRLLEGQKILQSYVDKLDAARSASERLAQVKMPTSAINIDARLGIGGKGAGSAQDSAEAFMAEFGGLEGLAREKSLEAGRAFAAGLNQTLVAGVAKSARDSASIFQAEFERLDQIAGLKAQQIGAEFTASLNGRLTAGIGKSAKDSASVFQAEFDKLDDIARVKAAHISEVTQRGISEAFGVGSVPKSARDSAAVFEQFAQAEDDAAASAKRLRDAINPLEAEMGRIGREMANYAKLVKSGHVTQEQFNQFQAVGAKRLEDFGHSLKNAGTAGRLMSGELANLSYQLNDVVTGLALGQSPFMIIAQQGGQVYQILANTKGGVAGALKELGSMFTAMITPARVGFGAIAAVIGTALVTLLKFQGAQMEVARQLAGMGRASGATVQGIDRIAQENASLGGFSVKEARNLSAALAATGKVGVDSIGPIVALGHDFAKTFGIDAAEATELLARSFADPVRGAEELNQRLGFLDANMKRAMESALAMGDRQRAVRILTDELKKSLVDASSITSVFSQAWTVTTNAVSNFFDRVGRGADRLFGGGSGLDENIRALTVELLSLERAKIEGGFWNWLNTEFGGPEKRIAEINEQLRKLAGQRSAQQPDPDVGAKQRAREIDDLARAMLPAIDAERKMADATAALNQAMNDPAIRKYLTVVGTDLVLAFQRYAAARQAVQGFDPVKNQIADMESQVRLLDRRSPSDRGREAADAERRRQQNDPNAGTLEERNRKIGLAALQAAGGQTALDNVERTRIGTLGTLATVTEQVRMRQLDLTEAERQGAGVTSEQAKQILTLAREQAIGITQVKAQADAYRVQTDTIGMSVAKSAEYTAWKTRELEAIRNGAPLREKELEQLKEEARLLGLAARAAAEKSLQDQTTFDRQTMFMESNEQRIAQQMKQVYGPEWQSQMNGSLATQMRLNDALRTYGDTGREVFMGVAQALRDGKINADELSSILDRLSTKLMDLAGNYLWSAINTGLMGMLNPMSGGYNTAATGGVNPFPTPFADGGYTGAGAKYQPAGVVHAGEYVFRQEVVNRIGVPNLDRINRGYAVGGFVQPLPANVNLPQSPSRPSVAVGDTTIVIEGNADQVTVNEIRSILKDHQKKIANLDRGFDGRVGKVLSNVWRYD